MPHLDRKRGVEKSATRHAHSAYRVRRARHPKDESHRQAVPQSLFQAGHDGYVIAEHAGLL